MLVNRIAPGKARSKGNQKMNSKKSDWLVITLIVTMWWLTPSTAWPQSTLATKQISGFGGVDDVRSSITIRLEIGGGSIGVFTSPIFDQMALTPNDVGHVFPISQSNDAD